MAPHATNYSEIQQDEIEVLRSIYMEDFVEGEARTGAWNVGEFTSPRVDVLVSLCAGLGSLI